MIELAVLAIALALFVPCSFLFVQVAAGWLPRRSAGRGAREPTVVVLIPAHDESVGILATLGSVLPQLGAADRCVVVADNCTDDTAAIARLAGADVVERFDDAHRGKGYALDFGLATLHAAPPDVVVMIDADCVVAAGGIGRLAERAVSLDRPVQALYLMEASSDAARGARIAQFAWCVKNQVRPIGLDRLGLPCQLMGSGMAFPWPALRTIELASGHIVEDMKLGIDLAVDGRPPVFCEDVVVTSRFPTADDGSRTQRTRWEHGHLGMITSAVPGLIGRAIVTRDAHLLAMAIDILIPPLAMLAMLVVACAVLSIALTVFAGINQALMVAIANIVLLFAAVIIAWVRYGRAIVPLRMLAFAPWYAICKAPLYFAFFVKRQTEWVRSKRDLP